MKHAGISLIGVMGHGWYVEKRGAIKEDEEVIYIARSGFLILLFIFLRSRTTASSLRQNCRSKSLIFGKVN